jgi:hypothetical protein
MTMHYRVIDQHFGTPVLPASFETLSAAKEHADQLYQKTSRHHGVVRVEQVYTTSTLDDALKPQEVGDSYTHEKGLAAFKRAGERKKFLDRKGE